MNAFHRQEKGQHDFWTHFWCGLTLGVGGWVGLQMFDRLSSVKLDWPLG